MTIQGNYYTTIKQFTKEDGSYILIISFIKDYILNSEGNLLYIKNNYLFWLKWDISIIPYNHSGDAFNYYIIYFNNNQIILERKDFYFNNTYELYDDSITCQLMTYSNENVISWFFLTEIDNEYFINCTVFKAEENFEIIKTSELKIEGIYSDNLKSEVMSTDDRQKVLIVFLYMIGSRLCYVGYDININNFTYGYLGVNSFQTTFGNSLYIYISYFKATEEFIISFFYKYISYKSTTYYNVYLIYSIDKNFEYSFFGILSNLSLGNSFCQNTPFIISEGKYGYLLHKIFFSLAAQKYCIILNLDSPEIISLFIINKEIKIINQTELKSSCSSPKFICENYTNDYLNLSENYFLKNALLK